MGRVEEILSELENLFPDAHCELNHTNALELLIAVMLSAQTTDTSVNRLTEKLYTKYRSLEDYINVPLHRLENDLRQIGLFKNKAKNVQAACKAIHTTFGGRVPSSQAALESLPGVGRKTANVVLSVWFGEPRIAVDTHVSRVAKRLKLAYLKDTPEKVEAKLMRKLPRDRWSKSHHQFIFFGRYHCTARNPKCDGCPLKEHCRYPNHLNVR